MTDRDAAGVKVRGRLLQELVSDPPRRVFKRQLSGARIGLDVHRLDDDSQPVPLRKFAAEVLIAGGRFAEAMIQVGTEMSAMRQDLAAVQNKVDSLRSVIARQDSVIGRLSTLANMPVGPK